MSVDFANFTVAGFTTFTLEQFSTFPIFANLSRAAMFTLPFAVTGSGELGGIANRHVANVQLAQDSTTTLQYTVVDEEGDPVDFTGRELRFVAANWDGVRYAELSSIGTSPAISIRVPDEDTEEKNVIEVVIDEEITASPFAARYSLRDMGAGGAVVVEGFLTVGDSPI